MTLTQKIILFSVVCIIIIGLIYYMMKNSSLPPTIPDFDVVTPVSLEDPTAIPLVGPTVAPPIDPLVTIETKPLYTSTESKPSRYFVSWNPAPATATSTGAFKVFTESVPGSTKFTACRSRDSPTRFLIPPNGGDCPSGWTIGPQFYAYETAQPNTRPVCLGKAESPLRGRIGVDQTNCGVYGWTHTGMMYAPI